VTCIFVFLWYAAGVREGDRGTGRSVMCVVLVWDCFDMVLFRMISIGNMHFL
jgi:hypothetical protein